MAVQAADFFRPLKYRLNVSPISFKEMKDAKESVRAIFCAIDAENGY
jgi:DNA-binding NtrC family response regulator